jgi:hypothetical protein
VLQFQQVFARRLFYQSGSGFSMQGACSKLFIVIIVFGIAVASPLQAAPQHTRKKAAKTTVAPVHPQAPAGPLKPLNLDEIPASPPQVSYADGQLTIVAQNSTLNDILRAVHQQTGAVVETPGNANERVMVHIGPGPARDVLATLLNGSHFDYVMLGSAENPTAVAHVILTAKSGGAAETNPVQQANAGQPAPPPQPDQDVTQDVGTDDFASADDEPQGEIPADQPSPDADQAQQQPQQMPNGQVMRSPEQLLQELQQRQLQQQQNGGAPTPAAPQGYPIPPDQQAPPQQQ